MINREWGKDRKVCIIHINPCERFIQIVWEIFFFYYPISSENLTLKHTKNIVPSRSTFQTRNIAYVYMKLLKVDSFTEHFRGVLWKENLLSVIVNNSTSIQKKNEQSPHTLIYSLNTKKRGNDLWRWKCRNWLRTYINIWRGMSVSGIPTLPSWYVLLKNLSICI